MTSRQAIFVFVFCMAQGLTFAQNDAPSGNSSDAQGKSATVAPVPGSSATLSQEQIKQLIQRVADNDLENDKKQRDYTYVEREVQKTLDGKGKTKSTETKTYDILEVYGEQVERLTQKNDKPLSEKDAAKEEQKIQKIIDKREKESPEDRNKREQKEAKDRDEGMQFVREIADAYVFTDLGTEMVGGRETRVIGAEPRPGFVPHMKYANYLPKFHGRVWIDKADLQLTKMDVEALDTVSWGLFLARFHKGTGLVLEQTRVNDEVWLPQHMTFKLDARLGLIKGINLEDEQFFQDYRKFRADAKIVGMGEVQEPK